MYVLRTQYYVRLTDIPAGGTASRNSTSLSSVCILCASSYKSQAMLLKRSLRRLPSCLQG